MAGDHGGLVGEWGEDSFARATAETEQDGYDNKRDATNYIARWHDKLGKARQTY